MISDKQVVSTGHLNRIDILRGIAILAVFLFHSQSYLFPRYEKIYYTESGVLNVQSFQDFILNFSPIAYSWSGVMLFLIISGFLIHLGYLNNAERFNFNRFYNKQFWRIWLTYFIAWIFLCIATGKIGYYIFSSSGLKIVAANFFPVHNLTDETFFSVNPSFWSLALEMQLYILYPSLLVLRKQIGIRYTCLSLIFLSISSVIMGLTFEELGKSLWYDNSVIKFWFVWCCGAYLAEMYLRE